MPQGTPIDRCRFSPVAARGRSNGIDGAGALLLGHPSHTGTNGEAVPHFRSAPGRSASWPSLGCFGLPRPTIPPVGAWGAGAFDNDGAADWSAEFDGIDRATGLETIRDALEAVAGAAPDDYIEVDDGQRAVAAAELVAVIVGETGSRSPYNETALDWIARERPAADRSVLELARASLARVLGATSELAELWDEAESSSWRSSVTDLATRLGRRLR